MFLLINYAKYNKLYSLNILVNDTRVFDFVAYTTRSSYYRSKKALEQKEILHVRILEEKFDEIT